jgi:hypothetical protein
MELNSKFSEKIQAKMKAILCKRMITCKPNNAAAGCVKN